MSTDVKNSPEYRRLQKIKERKNKETTRRRRRRQRHGCAMVFRCSCFLIFWVVVLLVIAAALAKSGLVNVPILTPLLRGAETEVPSPQVESDETTPKSESGDSFSVTIGEDTLTTLANQAAADSDDPAYSDIRVDIEAENIKLTGQLLKPITTAFNLTAVPKARDEAIAIEVQSFSIGSLPLPSFLVSAIINNLITQQLKSLNQQLSTEAKITSIELGDDSITIEGIAP